MLSKAEADRRRAETTLPDPTDGPEWPVDVEDEREKKREKLDVSLLKLIQHPLNPRVNPGHRR